MAWHPAPPDRAGLHTSGAAHTAWKPQLPPSVSDSRQGSKTKERVSRRTSCHCHHGGPAAWCSELGVPPDRPVNPAVTREQGWLQLVRDLISPESSSKNNMGPDILALIKLAHNMFFT